METRIFIVPWVKIREPMPSNIAKYSPEVYSYGQIEDYGETVKGHFTDTTEKLDWVASQPDVEIVNGE